MLSNMDEQRKSTCREEEKTKAGAEKSRDTRETETEDPQPTPQSLVVPHLRPCPGSAALLLPGSLRDAPPYLLNIFLLHFSYFK